MLIKVLISDELEFVRVAKEYLSLEDLHWIRNHRVGRGKIGGKAAGLVLAWTILKQTLARFSDGGDPVRLAIPETYFVGADVSLRVHAGQRPGPLPEPEVQIASTRSRATTPRSAGCLCAGAFCPRHRSDDLRELLADGRRSTADRALVQPAGRQLRAVICRHVRERLLPQPGHAGRKPRRADRRPSPASMPASTTPTSCFTASSAASWTTMSAWRC